MSVINVYCDESCHLQRDHQPTMVLGALCCPANRRKSASERIKQLKIKHQIGATTEVKWVKISPQKLSFYLELIDLFFELDELTFRALVVPDKSVLAHDAFQQTHDEFYYKMWYFTLVPLLSRKHRFQIYLDKKDTRSEGRARKLWEVLSTSKVDFKREIITRMQHVQSHEVPLFQMADVLIGAISYANRRLETSAAKLAVVEHLRSKSRLQLTRSTLLREEKLNLFFWQSNAGGLA